MTSLQCSKFLYLFSLDIVVIQTMLSGIDYSVSLRSDIIFNVIKYVGENIFVLRRRCRLNRTVQYRAYELSVKDKDKLYSVDVAKQHARICACMHFATCQIICIFSSSSVSIVFCDNRAQTCIFN